MVPKWREVANCSRCVKQQQGTHYRRQWTAELEVRSVQTLTTTSVFALNWCRLHVEVRHRDIPAPGYADSGRRKPTVCTRHAVVLATSAGREEVALRSRTSVSRRSDVQQRSRQTAACRTCSLVNQLMWRCRNPIVTGAKRRSATAKTGLVRNRRIAHIWRKAVKQLDADLVTCVVMVQVHKRN